MKIVFIGGGGFAEELLSWFDEQTLSKVEGYLGAAENSNLKLKYLGTFEAIRQLQDRQFILAVGNPKYRQTAMGIINEVGARLGGFIHPTALIADSAKIGIGTVVGPFCVVSVGAEIGERTFMNCYSSVGHHSSIGCDSVLNPYVAITGECKVGDRVQFGVKSGTLPRIKIPSDTIIAPGAVVYRSVREAATMMGIPAKAIKGL